MRISSANVDMYSNRTYSNENYEQETIREVSQSIKIPIIRLEQEKQAQKEAAEQAAEEAEEQQKERSKKKNTEDTTYVYAGKISTVEEKKDSRTIRQQCILYLLEVLLLNRERRRDGQKVKNVTYQEWLSEKENARTGQTSSDSRQQRTYTNLTGDSAGTTGTLVGVRAGTLHTVQASKTCYYKEQERTSYETTGKVVTADGREIAFNLKFAMSRSFEKYYNENYETNVVSFCDPLVINLDSTMPHVSDQKFLFDLDADGVMETISMMENKSGYLAIDKNQDGQINDGRELFGTESGDGFEDLSKYDEDGNGWIDEADEIWGKVMIWCMDENGKSELYHISEKGIGAICLQNVSSNFSLNSLKTNQTNATVRNTGIFLYENGNVGTVQHMDLAI